MVHRKFFLFALSSMGMSSKYQVTYIELYLDKVRRLLSSFVDCYFWELIFVLSIPVRNNTLTLCNPGRLAGSVRKREAVNNDKFSMKLYTYYQTPMTIQRSSAARHKDRFKYRQKVPSMQQEEKLIKPNIRRYYPSKN